MKMRQWVLICLRAMPVVLALNGQAVSDAPGQTVHEAEEHAEVGLRFAQRQDLKNAESELRRAVELSPNNPQYLTALGGVLGMQGELEESSSCFEKALKLDPENLVTRRNLASNQWQMDHLDAAEQNLEMILRAKPGDPRTILLLGIVENSMRDYAKAAKLLQSVAELVHQQPESLAALACAYYHTGEKPRARQVLEGLLAQRAEGRGIFLGAQTAADAADYETAEKLFRSIRSTYGNPAAVGYHLALVQYRQDHFEESRRTLLDLLAQGHETVEIYNLLAWCYQKQGESEKAVQTFNEAVKRIPETELDYLKLGLALAKNKYYPTAYEVAKRAVELAPTSEKAYRLKGMVELYNGDYVQAVQSYSQALKLNPDSAEADLGLALAQSKAGMVPEAVATFERGIKRFPRDVYHYTAYARMLRKTGDQTAESRALSLLHTAISRSPWEPQPHFEFGNLLMAKGNAEEAVKELELAARLDPTGGRFHYSLSLAYRRCGRNAEASRELQLFEKLKNEEGDEFYRAAGAIRQ